MLLGWGFRKKRDSGNEKCIDVNQSFPHNSKTKRDMAKISAVLKHMKSDSYVVNFVKNRSKSICPGVEGLSLDNKKAM